MFSSKSTPQKTPQKGGDRRGGDKKGGKDDKKQIVNKPMASRPKPRKEPSPSPSPPPPSNPPSDDGDSDWQDEVDHSLKLAKRHGDKQRTIYAGLTHRLPHIPDKGRDKEVKLKASSGSTADEPAPRLFMGHSTKNLFNYFQKMKPLLKNNPGFLDKLLPPEKSHHMDSEATLSEAARLYLIHPVNVAFQALLKSGKLVCQAEAVDHQESRIDFSYYWVDAHGADHLICGLELKKRRAIKWDHFKNAWLNGPVSENQREIRELINSGTTQSYGTNLTSNAVWITKQCKKYSKQIPFIAVFDWETLVFFEFPKVSKGKDAFETREGGKYVAKNLTKGIWFEEDKPRKEPKETFRSMLLGYMIYAAESKGLDCFLDPSQALKMKTRHVKTSAVTTQRLYKKP